MNDDRPCTCPPMERPHPCARKFALSECKAATIMDPICYRWRHQKDEVWKYGHQPQHLVPPRGKEVIGYYIVQPLYTADALAAAREEGRQAGVEEAAKMCDEIAASRAASACDSEAYGAEDCASAIRALKEKQ